ncbi:MAG: helix-turn-helix transcriptional regulator [Pseudonocardiaceae bacterium]
MGIHGTLQKRQLGRTLRRLRERAGLSLEEVAPKLDWSASKLGRIETAEQGVDAHGVRSMLDLYDVGGAQWGEIIDMTREAKQKGWWHAYGLGNAGYLALETDAAVVYDYQLGYIPGLLQTADYIRTVFRGTPPPRTENDIDRIVQIRLFRQHRLTGDPPMELVAIVDETVLRRPIGGVDMMCQQLRHLVRPAALPSVCFQVLPIAVGVHQGLNGSFTVLDFAEPDEPTVAYVENSVSATHVRKEAESRPATSTDTRTQPGPPTLRKQQAGRVGITVSAAPIHSPVADASAAPR